MDNKSNYYYPSDLMDNTLNHCSSCNTSKKATAYFDNSSQNSVFNNGNIYPRNYIQQPAEQQGQSGQQQQQFYSQNYDANSQSGWQNNQNTQWQNNPNPQWQNQNWQADNNGQNVYPQNQNQPKQKNMFGSLNPEQLMSLLSSKGNFASLLGNIGQTNPQLSMLMNMMQNMPKAKKQTKSNEESSQSAEDSRKEKKYIKVKDYYKENQDE